uniref:Uncharacterized protein n=2 Tax=Opuntia streptacantha TaxID=393608 RepID=A0A7C9AM14_OPUST
MSGLAASPAKSCSMYSNTKYRLQDILEVTKPSSFTTLRWSSLRRIKISLAMNLTLSGSKLSNLTFFRATIFPVNESLALYTLLYVPCPILSIFSKVSARLGTQPLIASPATAESQDGHPAATCSPCRCLGGLLNLGFAFDPRFSPLGL